MGFAAEHTPEPEEHAVRLSPPNEFRGSPLGAVNKEILDLALAGFEPQQRILATQIAEAAYSLLFGGLKDYCLVPDKYKTSKLGIDNIDLDKLKPEEFAELLENPSGNIINPIYCHLEAITFFQGILSGDDGFCEMHDPLMPKVGAYLYGPPGCGKTHIMAAFAMLMRQHLEKQLQDTKAFIERQAFAVIKEVAKRNEQGDFIVDPEIETKVVYDITNPEVANTDEVKETVEIALNRGVIKVFKAAKNSTAVSPTDVLYIGFDPLVEMYEKQRETTLEQLILSPIVFVDDLHPKGNEARIQVIQHVIERRYEVGRPATFMTSNLEGAGLVGEDQKIIDRIKSRLGEMFYPINFEGAVDWRQSFKKLRVQKVQELVREMLSAQGHEPPAQQEASS